jgi:hypothetical protein
MRQEERNLKVIKAIPFMYDLDPTQADEIFHQNCVHHINGMTENGKGPDVIKVSIYELGKVFDESQTIFNDVIASGNKVAVRWTWKGKNKMSGSQWIFAGQSFFIFEKGKIVEYWANDNRYLEMLNHGFKIVPPSPSPTKK